MFGLHQPRYQPTLIPCQAGGTEAGARGETPVRPVPFASASFLIAALVLSAGNIFSAAPSLIGGAQ